MTTSKKGARKAAPKPRPAKKGPIPKRPVTAAPAPAPDRNTLQIGGRTVRLRKPRSVTMAYDVLAAAGRNELRATCAALGLCWEASPDLGAPAKYSDFRFDALAYGGAVLDALIARGVPMGEITEASRIAFLLITDSLVSGRDVQDAEGFSDPGEEA